MCSFIRWIAVGPGRCGEVCPFVMCGLVGTMLWCTTGSFLEVTCLTDVSLNAFALRSTSRGINLFYTLLVVQSWNTYK